MVLVVVVVLSMRLCALHISPLVRSEVLDSPSIPFVAGFSWSLGVHATA